jgi:hypothetical protein
MLSMCQNDWGVLFAYDPTIALPTIGDTWPAAYCSHLVVYEVPESIALPKLLNIAAFLSLQYGC